MALGWHGWGTVLVKDIRATGIHLSSDPLNLQAINGHVYFSADDGVHGNELWRSDGMAAGTVLVQNIAPGRASSDPLDFTTSGQRMFFNADNGTNGYELWALPLRAGPNRVYAPIVGR